MKQTTKVTNLSDEKMPIGIGFYTAFNVPFNSNSNDNNCKLILSIKDKWPQDHRNLSTGESVSLTENEEHYLNDCVSLMENAIEAQYMLKKMYIMGREFNGAIITDESKNMRAIYELGDKYKYITIWNDNGYACIEPQSWIINAPNINLDEDITGFKTIAPMETWSEETRIFVENIK